MPVQARPDTYTLSSAEAAKALGVDRHLFGTWWDPDRKGWDIPVGVETVFVPSIGHTVHKRRVPKALLIEIANYGRATA